MSFTVAGNLAKIEAIVKHCYPGIVVGTVGDQSHQAEASDHNPDSRGIVHAVDLMFENDTNFHAGAPATLTWLLTPGVRNSLQYVIHDRGIWSIGSGWIRKNYLGTDPHTNHIHVSGKHGSTGENKATGTGYDTTAEKMTPTGSPCATSHPSVPVAPPEDEVSWTDQLGIDPKLFGGATKAQAGVLLVDAAQYSLVTRNNSAALLTKVDALTAAVTAMAANGTSVDTQAVLAAIDKATAAESDTITELQAQVADLQQKLAAAGGALAG